MNTATVPVSSVLSPIYPSGCPDDVYLFNNGTKSVYISALSTTNTTSAFPLNPGSSIVWQKGTPLYAFTLGTDVSTIIVTDTVTSSFDASSVASQILDQGLASQIANQVALQGAPPLNTKTKILDVTGTVPQAGAPLTYGIDVSAYQSLDFYYTETYNGSSISWRVVDLKWTDATAAMVLEADAFVTEDSNNNLSDFAGSTSYHCAVKYPHLNVVLEANNVTTTTFHLVVYGSYRTLSKPVYENYSARWGADRTGYPSYNGAASLRYLYYHNTGVPASTSNLPIYLELQSGWYLLTAFATAPAAQAATWAYSINVQRNNAMLYGTNTQTTAAGGQTYLAPVSIFVPSDPVKLTLTNSTSVTLPEFGLTISGYGE